MTAAEEIAAMFGTQIDSGDDKKETKTKKDALASDNGGGPLTPQSLAGSRQRKIDKAAKEIVARIRKRQNGNK